MNNPKKIKVALLFGGKSAEHEVSIMSARNVYKALDKSKYDVTVIGISRTGQWFLVPDTLLLSKTDTVKELAKENKNISVSIAPARQGFLMSTKNKSITTSDVIFPVLHGPYGEDGSVQGLLKLAGIPYVGAGVLGSAVGMDKDVMKRLLRDAGLPIGKFVVLQSHEKPVVFDRLKKELGLPLFIKPANLGSSVGVSCVQNKSEYKQALAEALRYDNKVIIEENIPGREIECSVLGNENPAVSVPGEVITNHTRHAFYSYEAKYLDEYGAKLVIPARLTKKQTKEVQRLAVAVFQTLCCEGMGRVDFFLQNNGSFVINEINTIPGFTSISMYPKLWEISGISYPELLDKLIQLAIDRFKRDARL